MFETPRFFTPSRRVRFVAVHTAAPAESLRPDFPLVLNTGRVRDHWHTMTRTGKSPRLSGHRGEPCVDLHPDDAAALCLADGELARVTSAWGQVLVRVRVSDAQQPGQIFVPMHWSGQFAARARVGALVNPRTDPVSGQPEFKHTPVAVRPYRPRWHGFALSRRPLGVLPAGYWSRARRDGLWHYELAGEAVEADWPVFARGLLGVGEREPPLQWGELLDAAQHRYRAAGFRDGRLEAAVFIGPDHRLPPRDWLTGLFAKPALEREERARILAGTPGTGAGGDGGPVVCSCHGVGRNTLVQAICERGLDTVEALGQALGAGTNCGSCIPELKALIAEAGTDRAA
jgi:assimilatory nitrate reductase catalytic subunit